MKPAPEVPRPVSDAGSYPERFGAAMANVVAARIPLCLSTGGVLVAVGGGGGGAGYGGARVTPAAGVSTGFEFRFAVNAELSYSPPGDQVVYSLSTGPKASSAFAPALLSSPAAAASLRAALAQGLGATNNGECSNTSTLDVAGPQWQSAVLQQGDVSPYLPGLGPVFDVGASGGSLLRYASPVYYPGQGGGCR
jgi:hypothetical protein